MRHELLLVPLLTLALACGGARQTTDTTFEPPSITATAVAIAVEPPVPGADSIQQLIRDVYDVISGPAGQQRDWARMRSLFAPHARLSAMVPRMPPDSMATASRPSIIMTIDDWIQRSEPFLMRDGFFEVEVFNEIERYGHVAHVWSTYESRTGSPDSAPFDRGINSFQLVWGEGRWWVWSILWHSERAGAGTIPERYLQ